MYPFVTLSLNLRAMKLSVKLSCSDLFARDLAFVVRNSTWNMILRLQSYRANNMMANLLMPLNEGML